jgi:ParB family transcriptional regulator, chromosome partitioning protein
VARRSGLGKGLGALIPTGTVGTEGSAYQEIPISAIRPNSHQPRRGFDEEALGTLAHSIRELGVLQPVLVRPLDDGAFELIAGERRWRAAKRAGLQSVPAIVRHADDAVSLEQALVENVQREDLNPLDEAAAFQQLVEDFKLTHEELAARVGKSRVAITNALRLFQLPPSIQKLVADSALSAGHARALLGTPDRAYQEQLARKAVAEGWSVRATEEAVRHRQEPRATSARHARLRPPGLLELEQLLSSHLDTKVSVEMGASRGRVTIRFSTLEDLERIYRAMTQGDQAPSPLAT